MCDWLDLCWIRGRSNTTTHYKLVFGGFLCSFGERKLLKETKSFWKEKLYCSGVHTAGEFKWMKDSVSETVFVWRWPEKISSTPTWKSLKWKTWREQVRCRAIREKEGKELVAALCASDRCEIKVYSCSDNGRKVWKLVACRQATSSEETVDAVIVKELMLKQKN